MTDKELEKLANSYAGKHQEFHKDGTAWDFEKIQRSFIAGYKTNKALYTEEDLRKCFEKGIDFEKDDNKNAYDDYKYNKDIVFDDLIESLNKQL